jgi:hypothetical protein
MNGRLPLVGLVLALLLLFAIPTIATADDFTGKVTSAGEGKLVVMAGEDQLTFVVNDATKITVDGKEGKLADVKAGHSVKVSATKEGENWIASSINCRAAK